MDRTVMTDGIAWLQPVLQFFLYICLLLRCNGIKPIYGVTERQPNNLVDFLR